jgi:cytochrome P450
MDLGFETAGQFVPTAPTPHKAALPSWRLFVGEAARNVISSGAEANYTELYISGRVVGRHYIAVNDPDAIKRIFLDNQPNYTKPSFLRRVLPSIADGLFGAEGADWRSQRQLMAPVFTPAHVADFMPVFSAVACRAADAWDAQGPGVIDVARGATRATYDVIGRTLFSSEQGLTGDEAAHAVGLLLADAGRLRLATLLPMLPKDLGRGEAAEAERLIEGRIAAFVARRQADPDPPPDFMTRMVTAFAVEHPPKVAARLALSNALTFLVAGHETTANALAWTLYLLSQQPQAQAWAAEEAREALSAGPDPQAVLDRLVYLRWVLDEALRLYPPAPRIERQALADDQLGPLAIHAGDLVGVWPWFVHRHRALWRDPAVFDPENFSPEAKAGHHRFQYIPFGAGPRVCIGAQFATAEALLMLAHWLARFTFEPAPDHHVEVASDIALRPKGGLPLRVSRRA